MVEERERQPYRVGSELIFSAACSCCKSVDDGTDGECRSCKCGWRVSELQVLQLQLFEKKKKRKADRGA